MKENGSRLVTEIPSFFTIFLKIKSLTKVAGARRSPITVLEIVHLSPLSVVTRPPSNFDDALATEQALGVRELTTTFETRDVGSIHTPQQFN